MTRALPALIAALALFSTADAAEQVTLDPQALAESVTIYRDAYGVPHIDGATDEAAVFGFAYCQAEDYLWQIEDSYVRGLGRYAELYGERVFDRDRRSRMFEIARTAKEDFHKKLDAESRSICTAFVTGLNYYLDTHPQAKLRLLTRFEPWYLLAFGRDVVMDRIYEGPRNPPPAGVGSNAWAIGPRKTRSGSTMLFANPHQPYYGTGQFYEAHLRSGEGWNFLGATFFGSPLPSIGHNEHLGWTYTVNDPDTGDSWVETFDDPENPLNYRYDGGYRTAVEWTDSIRVKTEDGFETREVTFRKTHHGPIARQLSETQGIAVAIARFRDTLSGRQTLRQIKSRNLDEFLAAMSGLDQHLYNTVYADRHGQIMYLYNGTVPRRDPGFDWQQAVDGSNPKTEWQGMHTLDELPRVINPRSGYVQSCNQSPFTTTDDDNPAVGDFPPYMVEEKDQHRDRRRAQISRFLLRNLRDVTFDHWQETVLDTTIYWALTELPRFRSKLENLKRTDPSTAAEAEPYLAHLSDWDCRASHDSTQATLCVAWYEELYGSGYGMGETLHPQFVANPSAQLKALVTAAKKIKTVFGDWKVPYGKICRHQRHDKVVRLEEIPFSDRTPSLPMAGVPGPMGAAFTVYYTPVDPFRGRLKRYAVVGNSYMAAVEFGDTVRSATLLQYGNSSDPKSPHYFDQGALMSQGKLKPMPFYFDDVKAAAKRVYKPGEKAAQTAR